MHGVPHDLNLLPFVGCTLDQIALGAHEIQFRFSGPGGYPSPSLAVEGHWELRGADGEVIDQAPGDHQLPSEREVYRVHRALSHTVVRTEVDPPTSITLAFEDGTTLTVWDSSAPHFESFQVEPGGYVI